MGTYHLQIPKRAPLRQALTDIPKMVKAYLADGLALFDKVPEDYGPVLLQVVTESIRSGQPLAEPELGPKLGMSKEDSKSLLTAGGFVASVLADRNETAEEFVNVAVATGLADPSNKEAVLRLAESVVKARASVGKAIADARLGREVLPSLLEFEITVDLRIGFDNDRVETFVPLALIHVGTDARGQELWMQATKGQVELAIESFQGALRKMEEAQKWAAKSPQAG